MLLENTLKRIRIRYRKFKKKYPRVTNGLEFVLLLFGSGD